MSCLLTFQWAMGIIKSCLSSQRVQPCHIYLEERRIVWPGVLVISHMPSTYNTKETEKPKCSEIILLTQGTYKKIKFQ